MATAATKTIHEALSSVMGDVRSVGKNDRNQAQQFNFRGVDAVVNAVGPRLRAHGVIVVPDVRDLKFSTVEVGKNRTPMGHVIVTVGYTFYGPAGDSIPTCTVGEAMDSGDKAVAKAMSVAFRICLLQALALPTSDTDPDAESYERSARTAPDVDPSKLTRTKGAPQGDDPWTTHADPLTAKKREVWNAAIAAGVIDPTDPEARAALAAEYGKQQGGDLAAATLEELDQYLATLKSAAGGS